MTHPQDSRPVLHVLFEGSPHLASYLNRYIPAVFFGYFGVIALANSLQPTWLTHWFEIWSPLIDPMQKIFPIFDNVESWLAAIGLSHRAAIVHHLLLAGWLMFAITFILCTTTVLRMSRDHWIKAARVHYAAKFAMASTTLLLVSAVALFFASIGIRSSGSALYDWYRHDLQLLWIACFFYVALITWVGGLTMLIAAFFAYSGKTPGNDPTTAN